MKANESITEILAELRKAPDACLELAKHDELIRQTGTTYAYAFGALEENIRTACARIESLLFERKRAA